MNLPVEPGASTPTNFIKFIRIFLLVLILIGIALLGAQNIWVPVLVGQIVKPTSAQIPTSNIENSNPANFSARDNAWKPIAALPKNTLAVYSYKDGKVVASVGGNYNQPVPIADPNAFRVFVNNQRFAKDSKNVYFESSIVGGADPKTFIPIAAGATYGRDANAIYCVHDSSDMEVIPGSDPYTFSILVDLVNFGPGGTEQDVYASDANHVYHFCDVIQNARPDSYYPLGYAAYAIDRSTEKVFYYGKAIDGADANTFEVISGQTTYDAQDKNRRYLQGKSTQ